MDFFHFLSIICLKPMEMTAFHIVWNTGLSENIGAVHTCDTGSVWVNDAFER